jgi:hypothetical protein
MDCIFCGKVCKNSNSKRNHERLCKLNINRQVHPSKTEAWFNAMRSKKGSGSNQWTKANQTGIPYVVREETRKKLSESGKKQVWSEERKANHRLAMAKAVADNPESYTSSNRGRTKQIVVDGIKFQGKWELEFYQYCKSTDVKICRSNEWFEYEWNGIRKYFPDFYLPEYDLYVEVKGYETDRDRAKWKAFPKQLKVIRKQDIIDIRRGCFGGL